MRARKFGVVLGVVAVVAVGTACQPTEGSTVTTQADDPGASPGTKAPAPGKPKAKAPAKAPARVGSSITIKGNTDGSQLTVTVLKVVPTTRGKDFSKPDAGNRFVAVQFLLVNSGSVGYDDAPSNGSKIVDAESQQYDTDAFDQVVAGQSLPSSLKLAPGGRAKGFLVYQVPVAAKLASVQFSMDSGFGATGEWLLT